MSELLTQIALETIIKPTTTRARDSQMCLEVITGSYNKSLTRNSQICLEVMIQNFSTPTVTGRILGPAIQCI